MQWLIKFNYLLRCNNLGRNTKLTEVWAYMSRKGC